MLIWKFSIGIGIALGLVACTRTRLSTVWDAAVDVKLVSDVAPALDLASVRSDAAPLVPDAALLVSDTTVVVPDAAVPLPDAAVALRDTAVSVPDTVVVFRDTAVVVPDTAIISRDSAIWVPDVAPDTSNVRLDATVLPVDSRDTVPNPFANQTFRIAPENPAPTPDPACTQYEAVDNFLLTFGSDISTLNGLAVRGSAATKFHATVGPESDRLTYHIDDLLAGGRVFIELDHGVYVGEVIVYGSGVPIARCLRGTLSPQP
jgi:hypothetical protein